MRFQGDGALPAERTESGCACMPLTSALGRGGETEEERRVRRVRGIE